MPLLGDRPPEPILLCIEITELIFIACFLLVLSILWFLLEVINMKNLIFVTCLLLALSILWMSRYSLVAIHQTNPPIIYKLNRFTGKVTVIIFDQEQSIKDKTHI